MRVLIFSQYFWPETFRINEVTDSLMKAGCSITVLTGQPNYPDGTIYDGYDSFSLKVQIRDGLTIYRVPLVPRGRGSSIRLVLNYLSFIASATVFGPWLMRGQKFDVVLVYGVSPILQAIPAIFLTWIKAAKLVTWVQDLWPESLRITGFVRNPMVLSTVGVAVRWIYRRSDLLLVSSKAFITPVEKMAGRTPVIYYPNPGEWIYSKQNLYGKPKLILEPGFNVVFAGNLGTAQALETILEAAETLLPYMEIRFVLIGSGSRSAWLETQVVQRKLKNVYLPGRYSSGDMPGILSQASVLLVSLAHDAILTQTVPGKLQVYLALGLPIIASVDGETARLVEKSGAGLVCPAENAKALAQAVLQLSVASNEELRIMGDSGRDFYNENFDPATLTSHLLDLLDQVVGRTKIL